MRFFRKSPKQEKKQPAEPVNINIPLPPYADGHLFTIPITQDRVRALIPKFIKVFSSPDFENYPALYGSGDIGGYALPMILALTHNDDYEPPTEFKNYKEPISLACVFRMLLQTIEGSLVSDKMLAVLCQDAWDLPELCESLRAAVTPGDEHKIVLMAQLFPHLCAVMAPRSIDEIAARWAESLLPPVPPRELHRISVHQTSRGRKKALALLMTFFGCAFSNVEMYRQVSETTLAEETKEEEAVEPAKKKISLGEKIKRMFGKVGRLFSCCVPR